MKYRTIGFIGLGLIGGSIAKTIHTHYPEVRMIARAGHQSTIDEAFQDGVIANQSMAEIEDYRDCDLIFLCSPVGINISYLKQLAPVISEHCILTDVGSVKGDIQEAVVSMHMDDRFIGGHPMCGSETIGYSHSSDHLLENAYYLLIHTDAIDNDIVSEFADFITSLGALVMTMTPQEHDFATAAISHLPHIISASLVNLVRNSDDGRSTLKEIAAGGFRDITRISSSSPIMWEHICKSNSVEILHMLDLYESYLEQFRKVISAHNGDAIRELFQNAKDYRDSLPIRNTGLLPNVYEFYCDLIDEAGGIATIATILAVAHLSIRNIGIVHNREFQDGVLKIEMYDRESMESAISLLQQHHYIIHRR